jgi:hypothetical protein
MTQSASSVRNTSKEKKKRNKEFPYRKQKEVKNGR